MYKDDIKEYCDSKNFGILKEEDCFCQIKSNTYSIEEYVKNNINNFYFYNNATTIDVWKSSFLDYETSTEIVKNNETLSKINEVIKISNCMIMNVSSNSWVTWHYDTPRRGPALNLLLTPEARSFSIFTSKYPEVSNLIECKYVPHQFCLYNTDVVHSILNFETPRYMFTACFERGQTDLTWKEAKDTLSSIGLLL
jgi:hypothetical protein